MSTDDQEVDCAKVDGKLVVENKSDLPHDARSVVAANQNGQLLFVVIFDSRSIAANNAGEIRLARKTTSTGPTLYDIAELLARPNERGGLSATWVLNLDGGWSTSMHARFDGQVVSLVAYKATINAIVATPSD